MSEEEMAVCEDASRGFDGDELNAATFTRMVEAVARALNQAKPRLGDLFSAGPSRADYTALVYVTGKWMERTHR